MNDFTSEIAAGEGFLHGEYKIFYFVFVEVHEQSFSDEKNWFVCGFYGFHPGEIQDR